MKARHTSPACKESGEQEEKLEKEEKRIQTDDENRFSPCGLTDKSCIQKQQVILNRQQILNNAKFLKTLNFQPVIEVRTGTCHKELKKAMERLSSYHTKTQEDFLNIPIPNCDRSGFFNPKQCHPALDGQRGKCWCVDWKTGLELAGAYDPVLDPNCQLTSKNI